MGKLRPLLILLASHWLSLAGGVLVTTAVVLWVLFFAFASQSENPYLGILFYLLIPGIFFVGWILILTGAWLAKRKLRRSIAAEVSDGRQAIRRALILLGVTLAVNLVVGAQFTYQAVEHMDSAQFCGQSCHVMSPEFRVTQVSGHSKVACARCHIEPGAAGWFTAKMAGTRQLVEVALDTHSRPLHSGLESGRLAPAEQTCERCHQRGRYIGALLKVRPKYADDEKNTVSHTVLMMVVGGGAGKGIHGAHLDPDIEIQFLAADGKRQQIPWVQWRRKSTGETREYSVPGAKKEGTIAVMQCVDCHNRAAHGFRTPEASVDRALGLGELAVGLPFLRKQSVELLKAKYGSQAEAEEKIRAGLSAFYEKSYAEMARERQADIQGAAAVLFDIYSRNVFPDLKVDWGTYPNNLGHTDYPGCFRCHDGEHSTKDGGRTIGQDCSFCHEVLAVDETDPEILHKLNLAERLAGLQKN